LAAAALALANWPQTAAACAVCYGRSDSPLAQGFNWGIVSLLFVVFIVLSGITSFFIFIAKRAANPPADAPGSDSHFG
jgi:hypothetical protein